MQVCLYALGVVKNKDCRMLLYTNVCYTDEAFKTRLELSFPWKQQSKRGKINGKKLAKRIMESSNGGWHPRLLLKTSHQKANLCTSTAFISTFSLYIWKQTNVFLTLFSFGPVGLKAPQGNRTPRETKAARQDSWTLSKVRQIRVTLYFSGLCFPSKEFSVLYRC